MSAERASAGEGGEGHSMLMDPPANQTNRNHTDKQTCSFHLLAELRIQRLTQQKASLATAAIFIREADSLVAFCWHLKTHLFSEWLCTLCLVLVLSFFKLFIFKFLWLSFYPRFSALSIKVNGIMQCKSGQHHHHRHRYHHHRYHRYQHHNYYQLQHYHHHHCHCCCVHQHYRHHYHHHHHCCHHHHHYHHHHRRHHHHHHHHHYHHHHYCHHHHEHQHLFAIFPAAAVRAWPVAEPECVQSGLFWPWWWQWRCQAQSGQDCVGAQSPLPRKVGSCFTCLFSAKWVSFLLDLTRPRKFNAKRKQS